MIITALCMTGYIFLSCYAGAPLSVQIIGCVVILLPGTLGATWKWL